MAAKPHGMCYICIIKVLVSTLVSRIIIRIQHGDPTVAHKCKIQYEQIKE